MATTQRSSICRQLRESLDNNLFLLCGFANIVILYGEIHTRETLLPSLVNVPED